MPSRFGIEAVDVGKDKPEMEVSFFHDSADCLKGEEHDWSGSRCFWDRCEDPSHEGLSDDEHEKACMESPSDLCRSPSGSERYCVKCGMGAMHHSLMTSE